MVSCAQGNAKISDNGVLEQMMFVTLHMELSVLIVLNCAVMQLTGTRTTSLVTGLKMERFKVLGPGALVTTNTVPGPGIPGSMVDPLLKTLHVLTHLTKCLP